jgi:uncharacterized protein (TIRG00374 family)
MKSYIKKIIIGLFTLVLILIMFIFVDINKILNNIRTLNIMGILLFILIYTIAFLLRAYRLKLILNNFNSNIPFSTIFGSYGIGWGINEITPGKVGDLVRIEIVNESDKKGDLIQSFSGILIERVIDIIILFAISATILMSMYIINIEALNELNLSLYVLLFGFFLFGGLILLILLFFKPEPILKSIGKISEKLKMFVEKIIYKFLDSITIFMKSQNKLFILIISTFTWIVETFTLVLFFYLLGFNINVLIIILAQIIIFFSKVLPLTPGGWVVSENIGTIFIIIFYPALVYQDILSVIILDHVIRIGYIFIFTIISALFLNISFTKKGFEEIKKLESKKESLVPVKEKEFSSDKNANKFNSIG